MTATRDDGIGHERKGHDAAETFGAICRHCKQLSQRQKARCTCTRRHAVVSVSRRRHVRSSPVFWKKCAGSTCRSPVQVHEETPLPAGSTSSAPVTRKQPTRSFSTSSSSPSSNRYLEATSRDTRKQVTGRTRLQVVRVLLPQPLHVNDGQKRWNREKCMPFERTVLAYVMSSTERPLEMDPVHVFGGRLLFQQPLEHFHRRLCQWQRRGSPSLRFPASPSRSTVTGGSGPR